MLICQTVTLEIRTQIADLPTARAMWEYLEHRYCGSSQAQLYTFYQALSSLQQGEDTVDQFYSRYCALWRQIDALTPSYCTTHAAQIFTCSESCSRRRQRDETRRMYEFIMRLRPEFESTRAQLLHAPSAYSLDEAFTFVRAEETRLRGSFTRGGSALVVPRLASTSPASSSTRSLPSPPVSSRPSPRPKRQVTCYYCGIPGHLERDCRKKQRGLPHIAPHGTSSPAPPILPLPYSPQVHSVQTSPTPSPTLLSAADQQLLAMFRQFQQSHLTDSTSSSTGHARSAQVPSSAPGSSYPLWLLDSGASLHMTPDATHLHQSRPPLLTTRVRTADGTLLSVSSTGHFSSSAFSVPSVSHVPRLSMNLMSVSQLTDHNCQVIFYRTSCRVQDHSGMVIGAGRRHNGVYVLDSLHLPSSTRLVHQCHAAILSHHMWHHRLGHLCPTRMSSLVRLGVLGAVSPSSDVVCLGCKLGKQLQRPYPLSVSQTTAPFELIHSDVWGPAPFVSKGGNRYYVIFIDDYTRFT
ncbi:RNA-directed DNA polymerase protein [Dioscorea alata]|uniref:RNA-directed DNA polymerase protein n=1 Tax=Dioscorea alata TaxID=55571 RepID=A0ACB7UYK3_DIOAL|nr:RNA-directed DNA polymerase protein [Dioscorea alata]